MKVSAIAFVCFFMSGCATHPKPPSQCTMSILRQNEVFDGEIVRTFGRTRFGYNQLIRQPRAQGESGNITMEGYHIFPATRPMPDVEPEGRKLTVVINPCNHKLIRTFEPL